MQEYDISEAFRRIENELIASMIRNMSRHRVEEIKEGKQWSMWQAEQLKSLEQYRQRNRKKYGKEFAELNQEISKVVRRAREKGNMEQETRILQAIKKGYKVRGKNRNPASRGMDAEFFKINDRKLESLIAATTHDMQKAETAILRMSEDKYRKAIFNAQAYANTGAGTYEKAVDMATKDLLQAGLNCVEYKNGARHTLSDYADMAIRTASKRAYLQGEGEKRQEWGCHLVIINKRGNPCPKCLPFVNKVLIDDVWSGGSKADGDYPLMSSAIAAGLYHPRCKDGHTTYFPGISKPPNDNISKKEIQQIEDNYEEEQKRQQISRQVEKYKRLKDYSLDDENQKRYATRRNEWNFKNSEIERSKIKYTYSETVTNNSAIKSNDYRLRLDVLDESRNTKRSIWKNAQEMLEHRSGTKFEDLAFVDSTTGKSIINKSYDDENHAIPNKPMKKMLSDAQPYTIIGIHNHPGSSAPSVPDIVTCIQRKYKYGMVVCHNGAIYKYAVNEKIFNRVNAQFALDRLEKKGYTESVRKMLNDSGIDLEVL